MIKKCGLYASGYPSSALSICGCYETNKEKPEITGTLVIGNG